MQAVSSQFWHGSAPPQLTFGGIAPQELRAQRLARTRARMQEQLAEKQERDAREDAEREQKGDLRTAIRPRIEAWQSGKKVGTGICRVLPPSVRSVCVRIASYVVTAFATAAATIPIPCLNSSALEMERFSGAVEGRAAPSWEGCGDVQDNIRALLASLDTVLWEGSGWTKPGMADLVDKSRVKKAYMRANLIVHPDKVAQKGGSIEQVMPSLDC